MSHLLIGISVTDSNFLGVFVDGWGCLVSVSSCKNSLLCQCAIKKAEKYYKMKSGNC